MVMPKLPFSLFNFKYITSFDPKYYRASAAAGVDIDEEVYTCKDHHFAWLLSFNIDVVKTTGTNLEIGISRVYGAPKPAPTFIQYLIKETIGTETVNWPSAKTAAVHSVANHPLFLFPGDLLWVVQDLTALETIDHEGFYHIIEYKDPRYEK